MSGGLDPALRAVVEDAEGLLERTAAQVAAVDAGADFHLTMPGGRADGFSAGIRATAAWVAGMPMEESAPLLADADDGALAVLAVRLREVLDHVTAGIGS